MAQCRAVTNDGRQCTRKPILKANYCWQHNSRIDTTVRTLSVGVIISFILSAIGLLADLQGLNVPVISTIKDTFWQTESVLVPPVVLDLINNSEEEVIVSEMADFELLLGARTSIGTVVQGGRIKITPLGNEQNEAGSVFIPSQETVRAIGEFQGGDGLMTAILEDGNTDLQIILYEFPRGTNYSDHPFPFRIDYLEKYSLPIEFDGNRYYER